MVGNSSFLLVSSWVMVSVDEDGVMRKSCKVCSLCSLPIVDFSSVRVISASSGVMAMYVLSRLVRFLSLILLIWLLLSGILIL